MEELKTCPVCDSLPQTNKGVGDNWWVECSTCGTRTLPYNSESEALSAWNGTPTGSPINRRTDVLNLLFRLAIAPIKIAALMTLMALYATCIVLLAVYSVSMCNDVYAVQNDLDDAYLFASNVIRNIGHPNR